MKRICEIYDISKDYEMPTGTVLIIVSDIEKDKIISIENEEIEMYLKKFILNLNPIQRRRFKMYYIDNLTYRQIADIEKRNIKSIYESVQAGKKKFLKYLDKYPNKNTPTSLSL